MTYYKENTGPHVATSISNISIFCLYNDNLTYVLLINLLLFFNKQGLINVTK